MSTPMERPARGPGSAAGAPAARGDLHLPLTKPWGAALSHAEEAQYARGRAMVTLTGICLGCLLLGMALERTTLPTLWHHVAYTIAAVAGGWFALRSTLRALARLRFDVN